MTLCRKASDVTEVLYRKPTYARVCLALSSRILCAIRNSLSPRNCWKRNWSAHFNRKILSPRWIRPISSLYWSNNRDSQFVHVCVLLDIYAAQVGSWLPTFQDNIKVPSSRMQQCSCTGLPDLEDVTDTASKHLKRGPCGGSLSSLTDTFTSANQSIQ